MKISWSKKYRSQIAVLAVTVYSVLSGSTKAMITEHYSLDKLIADADNIIFGTIDSIDSSFSSTGEIYSVINFKDAKTIGPEGARDIEGTYRLYILGGFMPNPEFGRGIDKSPFVLSIIGGAPSFNDGDKMILFETGNGKLLYPLLGGDSGMLRIDKRNNMTTSDGRSIVGVGPELEVKTPIDFRNIKLISEAEPKHPSNSTLSETKKNQPVSLREMLTYISNRRADFRKNKSEHDHILSPIVSNPHFQ